MIDGDARAALVDMSVQSAADAEQQHGMPAEDCREALGHMASENLKEVEVGGEGSCLFLAVKGAMRGNGASMSAAQLRERVAVEMRDDGATTPEYAKQMLEAATWGTDREIQRIAAVIRRQVTVVVMRPREGEEVVQVFTPEHHEGSITLVHRPGHFNSTEVVEWRLNERGRRCMRRAAVALFELRMAQEVARRLSVWKQRQLRSAMELSKERASSTMHYQNWEVVLKGWNGGVRVVDKSNFVTWRSAG